MKADFGGFLFDKIKHYLAVVMQQGRIVLDSDWSDLIRRRRRRWWWPRK